MLSVILLITGSLFCSEFVAAGDLDTPQSQKLQSTFSYKFLKFVSWEPELQVNQFDFCILSRNYRLIKQLESLHNKTTLWGNVVVHSYPQTPTAHQLMLCNSIYVDTGYPYHSIQSSIKNGKMLTIVRDDIDSVGLGVFIFFIKKDKLKFKVNLIQARKKGIRVSASLLLLADEVIGN